jgi:hypothetical protein
MSSFFQYKAQSVSISDKELEVTLIDGRKVKASIEKFPLLRNASPSQKQNFEIIGGYAIHWPELNEDISIAGFFE